MLQKEINILWLSDIHFKEKYQKEDKVLEFISKFVEEVKIENKNNEITHVIFTGDIAFSAGNPEDYNAFEKTLLGEIKKVCKNSTYLFIPGNHDVDWDKVYGLYRIAKGKKVSLEEFFKYKEKVDKVSYSTIFKLINSEKYSVFPSVHSGSTDLEIDELGLFGYFYHREYKSLFILINSAFLSFGQIPKDLIIDEFTVKTLKLGYDNVLSQVIEDKEKLLSEYGNQTYAIHLFDKYLKKINQIIAENNPIVITLAHHPPEWLHWTERHSSNANLNSPMDKFVYKQSSLLLVGHEHSAPALGSRHGEHCLMLRAGMFLDDSVEPKDGIRETDLNYFPNNWYSILNIKNDCLHHRRYNYFLENDVCSWKDKPVLSYKNSNPLDKPVSFLPWNISESKPETKRTGWKQKKFVKPEIKIENVKCDQFNFIEFFKSKYKISINKKSETVPAPLGSKNIDYRIYTYKNNKKTDVIRVVFTNLNNLYNFSNHKMIHGEFIFTLLGSIIKKPIQNIDFDSETIFIVSIFDFYNVISAFSDIEGAGVREAIGDAIVVNEAKYNVFKHHFFAKLKRKPLLFEALHEMKFTYHFLNSNTYLDLIYAGD